MKPIDRIAFELGTAFLASTVWSAEGLAVSIAEGIEIDAELWPLEAQVAWMADITTRTPRPASPFP